MKKLVLKAAALALTLSLLLGALILCPWPERETFRNIPRKHAIARKIIGKKILLVGGSGVANGLSAGIIEKNLPGYQAVNMGVNAGLGLEFNLNEVRGLLQRGDLVVLSPEYDNFEGGYRGGLQILKAVNVAPFTLQYVSRERYRELLRGESLAFLQLKAQSNFDGITGILTHASVQLDDKGDRVSRSSLHDVGAMAFSFAPDPQAYAACVALLNEFDRFCRDRGVTALLSFPALPTVQYRAAQRNIDGLYRQLSKDTTMFILHPPAETVYDPSEFDDSVYHLGPRGREIRSLRVAGLVRARLAGGSVPSGLPRP